MNFLRKIAFLLFLLAGFIQAAQDINQASKKAIGIKMADPSLASPISTPGFDLQLTTENKDKNAKAKIGLWIGNNFIIDAKFIVPFENTDSEVEPINLDGLGKSSVLDLGIHYLSWNPKMDVDKAKEIQIEYLKRNPNVKNFILTLNNLKNEPDLYRRFLDAISWGTAYFAVLRTKIGRQDFSYINADFKEFNEQKTNIALDAAVGVLFPKSGYFGFNCEFQKYYEAGKSADLILPFKGGPAQQLKKYNINSPTKKDRNKFQIEYRNIIGSFGAINPKISYFFKDKVTLIEIPIYIFKSKEEGLNAGINMSWTSKDNGRFGLALFIGSAFSITPN